MPTIEERLAILEQRLDAATLALVPPIQIGELLDVPTAGSQLAAQWAQEASARVVHRFATVAARDAQYPAAVAGIGAVCFTRDTNTLWVVDTNTQWAKIRMGVYGNELYQVKPSSNMPISGSTTAFPINGTTLSMPAQAAAGSLFLSATVRFSQTAQYAAGVGTGLQFYVGNTSSGVVGPVYRIPDVAQETSHTLTMLAPGIAGAAFNVGILAGRLAAAGGTGSGTIIAADTTFQVVRYVP